MGPNDQIAISSSSPEVDITGATIAAQTVTACSAQLTATGTAAGSVKVQVSNDPPNSLGVPASAANWSDLSGATVNVTGAGSYLIPKLDVCYDFLRLVYTSTATGVQTVVVTGDTAGSLNNKYFYLNSANAGTNYYVWFNVSGGGIDPSIPGRTGVEVDIATDDTAATVGAALQSAVDALANFIATGTTTVTITNSASGPFIPATDAGLTGFTFAVTTPTGVISAELKTFSS